MKVKLVITYDGTNYCGWQVQPDKITVQQVVEDALEKVVGQKLKVIGSGRTDAGVHAKGQVAHFETPFENIPAEKFYKALNIQLPPDVKVLSSQRVDDDFSARRSAKSKTYSYFCYVSKVEKPLKERFSTKLDFQPDIEKMKDAVEVIVGEHDFKCMCSSGSGAKTTVREVYSIEIEQTGEDICFSVTGGGFLYNMVRILVSTLLEVGYGRITKEQVAEMLKTGKRISTIRTLSPKGLCLMKVEY